MSKEKEMAEMVRRYMSEKYGYEAELSEFLRMPKPELRWTWAIAQAYFREGNHFERLEEAPPGIEWITVIDGTTLWNYEWRISHEGETKGTMCYVRMNTITRKDYDAFYG